MGKIKNWKKKYNQQNFILWTQTIRPYRQVEVTPDGDQWETANNFTFPARKTHATKRDAIDNAISLMRANTHDGYSVR